MKKLLELIIAFFKIGFFTFGGGYAMLPLVKKEIVEKRGWSTDEEILNIFAIGQCTPGIIAVNTATFIGYKVKGITGGILATLAIIFPSVTLIILIALFLSNFKDNVYVIYAFNGIMSVVAALIIDAVIKMWKTGVKDYIGIALFLIAFLITVLTKLSPVYVIIFAGIVGLFVKRG